MEACWRMCMRRTVNKPKSLWESIEIKQSQLSYKIYNSPSYIKVWFQCKVCWTKWVSLNLVVQYPILRRIWLVVLNNNGFPEKWECLGPLGLQSFKPEWLLRAVVCLPARVGNTGAGDRSQLADVARLLPRNPATFYLIEMFGTRDRAIS